MEGPSELLSSNCKQSWATWYKSHILGEKVSLACHEFCACTLPGVTETSKGMVLPMPHEMWEWKFPRMKLDGITKLLGDGGCWAGENNMCLFSKDSFIGNAWIDQSLVGRSHFNVNRINTLL